MSQIYQNYCFQLMGLLNRPSWRALKFSDFLQENLLSMMTDTIASWVFSPHNGMITIIIPNWYLASTWAPQTPLQCAVFLPLKFYKIVYYYVNHVKKHSHYLRSKIKSPTWKTSIIKHNGPLKFSFLPYVALITEVQHIIFAFQVLI